MLDQWRARIGWIHPRANSAIEVYHFYQAAHSARSVFARAQSNNIMEHIAHLESLPSIRALTDLLQTR